MTGIYTPRTKIVCTLGPSTSTDDAIRGLIEAGMNVARVNFSHGTHEQHAATIAMVRHLADESGKPVAILGDLQGPRIRIGDLDKPITLKVGEDVVLVHEGEERNGEIPVTYDQLAHDVRVGDRILIDDGLIEFVALEVGNARVKARVLNGGPAQESQGDESSRHPGLRTLDHREGHRRHPLCRQAGSRLPRSQLRAPR